MYKAYITALTNVRPHSNADKLQLADVFGNTVCVSLDYYEGQVGLYLPSDGQISVEFGEKNNLLRKKADPGEWILAKANEYVDGPDPIGKTHLREGVVVRIVNRPKFAAYKTKSFEFRVLEGIVKANAEAPDLEEAQEILDAE